MLRELETALKRQAIEENKLAAKVGIALALGLSNTEIRQRFDIDAPQLTAIVTRLRKASAYMDSPILPVN